MTEDPGRATSKGLGTSNVCCERRGQQMAQHPSSDAVSPGQCNQTWLRSLAGCNQMRAAHVRPGAVHGLCAAGSSRVLFSAERVDCLLAPMSDLTKWLVGVLSNTCVPVPKSGTAVDKMSPTTTAGARVQCAGAWVRGCVGALVVPRLHRQSFGKGNLTLAPSRFAVSPWKERVPVGVNESPPRAAHRRISQLQLRLLLLTVYCSLLTAHCPLSTPTPRPRPIFAHTRYGPLLDSPRALPVDDDDTSLPPQFSALTAEPSTPARR